MDRPEAGDERCVEFEGYVVCRRDLESVVEVDEDEAWEPPAGDFVKEADSVGVVVDGVIMREADDAKEGYGLEEDGFGDGWRSIEGDAPRPGFEELATEFLEGDRPRAGPVVKPMSLLKLLLLLKLMEVVGAVVGLTTPT